MGVTAAELKTSYRVYPNPTSGNLILSLGTTVQNVKGYWDMMGRIVQRKNVDTVNQL